jgi:hypothetical protein
LSGHSHAKEPAAYPALLGKSRQSAGRPRAAGLILTKRAV